LATDTNKSTISANQTKELDKLITENNKASKDSEFGLPKTKTKNLLKNSIKTSIVNIKKTKNGKLIFTLKNDQKWIAKTSYRARTFSKTQTFGFMSGGGCSGFQYPYLYGSTLDFVEDLSGAKFVIKNPNAKTTCGCGESFTV